MPGHGLLDDPDAGDGVKAEEGVDAFHALVEFVSEQDGAGTVAGDDQRAGLERVVLVGAARPVDLFGPSVVAMGRAYDIGPGGDKVEIHAGAARDNRFQHPAGQFGDRHRIGTAPLRTAISCGHHNQTLDFARALTTLSAMPREALSSPAGTTGVVDPADLSAGNRLLEWYDRHARVLPWRTGPKARREGVRPDPYHVWLSEVMLQQTQVATVRDYFLAFLERWPTVRDLALASEDDVLKAWAGLGYYRRARNLKRCAEAVWHDHGGHFPDHAAALRDLSGIGDYTSAAIAAIAFDEPVAVVDGNVERVIARLHAIEKPVRSAKPLIRAHVEAMVSAKGNPGEGAGERPGDFAQAMMDLGATICSPKKPSCMLCPISEDCTAYAQGEPERYPLREAKAEKPLRRGAAFVAVDGDGAVLLRKRGDSGLLAGMSEVPTSGWTAARDGETGAEAAPFPADWREAGTVRHVFTHFALDLTVWQARITQRPEAEGWWSEADALAGEALPTVMKKALEAAIPGATKTSRRKSRS